jgi:ABC-2 type transport system ATP-binding protein
MKALIREHAAGGAAIIVSSHLLSLFEDLITTVLIMHHGRVLRHARLDELRGELTAEGRNETLEEMFFRLTEPSSSSSTAQSHHHHHQQHQLPETRIKEAQ